MSTVEQRVAALEASLEATKTEYNECLDTIWLMLATMLVFFMHSGFSLLEAGTVRFKNTQNILAKNLLVVTLGFLCWYVLGYPLALGVVEDPGKFAGHTNFFMQGFWGAKGSFKGWLFQGAFCATGGTIVSGAMAERTQLKGFTLFTTLMTSVIYPVVVYWGWSGNGLLNYSENDESKSFVGPAYNDFAGSGIVHMVGGVAGLCGAIIVGPRKGRFDPEQASAFDGHSVPFCVLGTFFLWFGWYGFNPGSTTAMHDAGTAHTAALVAVNTTLAPCVAGLLVFLLRAQALPPKALDVGGFCNGILGGLVAITGPCATVEPWEAVIIGLIGGLVYQGASMLLKRAQVDDVVDAFPVHGACGLWGVLAGGLFGNPDEGQGGNGALHGGDQFGTQIVAALLIIAWTAAWSALIFFALKFAGALRLSDEFQDQGADIMEHSPSKAYGYQGNDVTANSLAHSPAKEYAAPAAETVEETTLTTVKV